MARFLSRVANARALALERGRAGDDLDELRGDGRLARAVVEQRELPEHVLGVLRGVLHRLHPRPELGRAVFQERVVHHHAHVELREVQQELRALGALHLVLVELDRARLGGFLVLVRGENRRHRGLERDDALKPVVHDLVLLRPLREDGVRHQRRGGEREGDLRQVHDHVLHVFSLSLRELRASLLAHDGHGALVAQPADNLGVLHHRGVDTAAQALVRGHGHDHGLLRLDAGLIAEHAEQRLHDAARLLHLDLRALQARRRHHLHRRGDLLNVTDGLHALRDDLQRHRTRSARGERHGGARHIGAAQRPEQRGRALESVRSHRRTPSPRGFAARRLRARICLVMRSAALRSHSMFLSWLAGRRFL
mmetsp:Transcript_2107/g.8296  ORF Transcript_2107/g.8296 Transcript_2107/m.8296 type:complete len:366 (+) Transcript_2107:51-1148(+)